jgi:uridylate kinase
MVKGVFCSDPKKNADAVFLDRLTFTEVQEKQLKVMDTAAIALAQENHTPIAVFSIYEPDGFRKVLQGQIDFTLIH